MFILKTRLARMIAVSAVASAALTAPAMADFIGVSRCNASGGSSAPTLHFVNEGERFSIAIGQNGLTRSVIMNERRALAWAAASGLFPNATAFGNYSNHICGMAFEDGDASASRPSATDTVITTDFTECTACEY